MIAYLIPKVIYSLSLFKFPVNPVVFGCIHLLSISVLILYNIDSNI